MKVIILGDGLTSLALAKALVNQGIYVDILINKKFKNFDKFRTLGISKSNIQFFNEYILNIEKLLWKINKIEILSKNLKNEKIINFENSRNQLFSIIKNVDLYNHLISNLENNKLLKIKKNLASKKLLNTNSELIVNCDKDHPITKKYFNKKFFKNYDSYAYTTVIKHKKIIKNNIAQQIFTEVGPLAFLPLSEKETSIVLSAKKSENIDLKKIIEKYNQKYSILKINKILNHKLTSLNLRSYKHQNILAFGDLLHKVHPLAGQGFNMSLRDIRLLMSLIELRLSNGLTLDSSICSEFENKTKHKNYLFSNGIDFVYEFFNFERKLQNPFISKSIQFFGKNKYLNDFFIKSADRGIVI